MAGEVFIGGDVVIFSIYDGTDSWDPIACVTSSSISESVDVDEVNTKCDPGNTVKTAGAYSYEISVDGIYVDEAVDTGKFSHDLLKDLLRGKTLMEWSMATGITAPTTEFGSGFITSLDLTGDAGENATFTVTISGSGAISSTDPHP